MVFVICDSGNNDGYGKPLAVAYNRKEVEDYIKTNANANVRFRSNHDYDEIVVEGEVERPYGWREEAYCAKARAYKGANLIITTSYEVYSVKNAADVSALDALDFFGE